MADQVKSSAGVLGLLGLTPTGAAIAGGFLAVSSIYAWLRSRSEPDAHDSTMRLRPARRLSTGPAQIVVGNARTGGAVLYEADKEYPNGGGDRAAGDAPNDNRKTRYIYGARLLSEGPIHSVQACWVDGMLAPTNPPSGATLPPSKTLWTHRQGHNARLTVLTARQNALIPNSIVLGENGTQTIDTAALTAADPVALQLWEGLQTEVEGLARAAGWKLHFIDQDTRFIVNGWQHYWRRGGNTSAPTFRMQWGDGTGPDARPAARAVARAIGRAPGWRQTDIVQGVAWAFCEFRMWDREDVLFPWDAGSVPQLEFLVRGNPDLLSAGQGGANPAKFANWYLRTYCGADDRHVEGLNDAAAFCDEFVTIPAVSRTDAAEPSESQPITGPQVLEMFYGDDLPSTTVQDRVLAEFNAREAGRNNQRPRYSANGIIDGDMERDDVLDSLGVCMGGHIVDVGGQFRLRPGRNRAPVMIIQENEILGDTVQWVPDSGVGQAPNSLEVSIAQDRERGWTDSRLPPVDDDTHIGRDGLYRRSMKLPFVNDALDAQRLAHLYLRRDAYGLRRARFTVRGDTDPANALIPTDFVQLQVEGVNLRMRVVAVARDRGVLAIDAIECPDDVYTTQFLLPSQARDFTVQPPDPSDYDLAARFDWSWRSVDASVRLDLIPLFGADIGSVKVKVTKRPANPPAMNPPPTTTWEYVLTGADLPPNGQPFAVSAILAPAMIEDVTINPPTPAEATFNEGPTYLAEIELTGYSSDAYTAVNAGEIAGDPVTLVLKIPEPTDGTAGILDSIAWTPIDQVTQRLDITARSVAGSKSIRVKGVWDNIGTAIDGTPPPQIAPTQRVDGSAAGFSHADRDTLAFFGSTLNDVSVLVNDASSTNGPSGAGYKFFGQVIDPTAGTVAASRFLFFTHADGVPTGLNAPQTRAASTSDAVYIHVYESSPTPATLVPRSSLWVFDPESSTGRYLGQATFNGIPLELEDIAVAGDTLYGIGTQRNDAGMPIGTQSDRLYRHVGLPTEPGNFEFELVDGPSLRWEGGHPTQMRRFVGPAFYTLASDGTRLLAMGWYPDFPANLYRWGIFEIRPGPPVQVVLLTDAGAIGNAVLRRDSFAVSGSTSYFTQDVAGTPPSVDLQSLSLPSAPDPTHEPIREVYEYVLNDRELPPVGAFLETLRDVPNQPFAPGYAVMTNPADEPATFFPNDQAQITLEMSAYSSEDGTGEPLAKGTRVLRSPGAGPGGPAAVEYDEVRRYNANIAFVVLRSIQILGVRAVGGEPVYRLQGTEEWTHASLGGELVISEPATDENDAVIPDRWNIGVLNTFGLPDGVRKLFLAARTGDEAADFAYVGIKEIELYESPLPSQLVLRRTEPPGPDDLGEFDGQLWCVVPETEADEEDA